MPPANTKPDLLMDSEQQLVVSGSDGSQRSVVCVRRRGRGGGGKRFLIQPEDPHRRKYKLVLAVYFLFCTVLNFVLDLAFQVCGCGMWEERWDASHSLLPRKF